MRSGFFIPVNNDYDNDYEGEETIVRQSWKNLLGTQPANLVSDCF
jgi:hypothetical protein